jgi:hypothetical protein
VHQDGERLAIPSTGLLDQVSVHLDLGSSRPEWPRSPPLTEVPPPNVQMISRGTRRFMTKAVGAHSASGRSPPWS